MFSCSRLLDFAVLLCWNYPVEELAKGGNLMRIANYKIESQIRELKPFVNYNGTITAEIDERGIYRITHWRTTILEYDTTRDRLNWLEVGYISQTTSALVGRILRSLPRPAVEAYLPWIVRKDDFRRVKRMLRI
jgi:hypothetical protein